MRNRLWRVLKEAGQSPPSLEAVTAGELLDLIASALLAAAASTRRMPDDFRVPKSVTFSDRKRPQTPSTPNIYGDVSNFIMSPTSTRLFTQQKELDVTFDAHSPAVTDFKERLLKASRTLQALRE